MDIPSYYRSNCWNMVKLGSYIIFEGPIVVAISAPGKVNFVSSIEPI